MRVLVCALGSAGFVYPMIGVSHELMRRGHEVAIVTDPGFADRLAREGIRQIFNRTDPGSTLSFAEFTEPRCVARDFRFLERAAAAFQPDVILTHVLCNAPLLLRDVSGLPVAVMGTMLYLWPRPPVDRRYRRAQDLPAADRRRLRMLVETIRLLDSARAVCGIPQAELNGGADMGQVLDQARQLFGIPPHVSSQHSGCGTAAAGLDYRRSMRLAHASGLLGDLLMLRSVPCLEDPAMLPVPAFPAGACLWEPDYDHAAVWQELSHLLPDSDRPVLHVVLGGRSKDGGVFWPALEAAVAKLPVQVIVSGSIEERNTPLPSNVVSVPLMPQGILLPHVQGVVCSGKSTAVLGALTHGIPSVLIPSDGETAENAERLQEVGCALSLQLTEITPEGFVRAIQRILGDESIARAAGDMAHAFSGDAGFALPAQLLEQLVAPGPEKSHAGAAVLS